MEFLGSRRYVQIAGDKIHELPPLLVKEAPRDRRLTGVVDRAEAIIESDWLIPDDSPSDQKTAQALEHRRMGLAVNLAQQYLNFLTHWAWGESILEWIRQCEITFESKPVLRPLLRPDVWPHAGRASFVALLEDKRVPHGEVNLENAMGFRLTFRQPPPIDFFSEKFLFFLNSSMATSAYRTWAEASSESPAFLPPERFRFFVTGTDIRSV